MAKQSVVEAFSLFYSYAHEDETLCKKLEVHLSTLKRQKYITEWNDRNISAGVDWEREINSHLDTADIILLLISPDFIASDYCYSVEMLQAMDHHETRAARVIPIILRPTDWKGTPFEKLQVLPQNDRPVTKWSDQDDAFLNIAQGLRNAIDQMRSTSSSPLYQPLEPIKVKTSTLATWNMPYRRNPVFTGREELLRQLSDRLLTTNTAALTQAQAISGLGGIGKTQTAIEYAYRHRSDYRWIFWIRANSRERMIADFVALAELIEHPLRKEQDQPKVVAAVRSWLTMHDEWLLILDNADDPSMVEEFLPIEAEGHLVLTTRTQMGGPFWTMLDVEKMNVQEGILLLLRRAKVIAPDCSFEQVTTKNRVDAEAIVRELGGLPLALDQAGAYIEEMQCSLSEYLELYKNHRKVLLAYRKTRPYDEHPEPVATTWSLSFQRVEEMNPAAADLLRLCAFLDSESIPEKIIIEGALFLGDLIQSLAANPIAFYKAIQILRSFSLIQRKPEEKVLHVHRLVQAVLKDAMPEETQKQWVEWVIAAVGHTFPPPGPQTWADCRRLLPQALVCSALAEDYNLNNIEIAALLQRTAIYLQQQGIYSDAEPLLQRSLQMLEQVFGFEHPEVARGLSNMASLYDSQGKYKQAEPFLLRALQIQEQKPGPDMAFVLNNLGVLYRKQGKYEQAEPFLLRALQIQEQKFGPDHPETARCLNNLGVVYEKQGRYKKAQSAHQRALRILQQKLGPEHLGTVLSLCNLAIIYREQGKYEQAESFYQHALRIQERVLPEHPDTAHIHHELAFLYATQTKYEQAEILYQRALQVQEELLGPEHPGTVRTLTNLTFLYRRADKYEKAIPLLQRVLEIQERVQGPEHADLIDPLIELAILYSWQDKYVEAISLLRHALRIQERTSGTEHYDTIFICASLAFLYRRRGEYEQATQLLRHGTLGVKELVLFFERLQKLIFLES